MKLKMSSAIFPVDIFNANHPDYTSSFAEAAAPKLVLQCIQRGAIQKSVLHVFKLLQIKILKPLFS